MKKIIKIIFLVTLIIILSAVFFYNRCLGVRLSPNDTNNVVKIEKGEGVKIVAQKLYQAGYITSPFCLEIYAWLTGQEAKIKAGEYELPNGLNAREIFNLFVSGQTVNQERTAKIIEGWQIKDITSYLKKENLTDSQTFYQAVSKPISKWQFDFSQPDFLSDAPGAANLEGYLFPDTYRIYKDANAADLIEKMLNNFGTKLDKNLRADITGQNKKIFDIITMASILEKEVRSYEDMRIVAGIFWNRIKIGQALESCATLAYVLQVDKKQYTQADTEVDSPYNTYRYRGLPPGPICNPGLNAIKAAIYPQDTDYNYFLSRPDNGQTVFSKTYTEHLANKAKYLP